ncbi:MAG: hypothetical protein EOP84_02880 [Verrucomicrobiaceae bacterium]|nr:MAG: hypothetical protein EOP84_02880 [Verrucomicrobiaceae bacterium]
MKMMCTLSGLEYGVMFQARDPQVSYAGHGQCLDVSEELSEWIGMLSRPPRIDRTPMYVLVIPQCDEDMLYMKMKWKRA